MAAKRKSRSAAAGKAAGLPGRGFRVLVVDDAEGIRTYLAILHEASGTMSTRRKTESALSHCWTAERLPTRSFSM